MDAHVSFFCGFASFFLISAEFASVLSAIFLVASSSFLALRLLRRGTRFALTSTRFPLLISGTEMRKEESVDVDWSLIPEEDSARKPTRRHRCIWR